MTDTIIVTPQPAVEVTVTPTTPSSSNPSTVNIYTGTPGPTGPVGPTGPTGPAGGNFLFTQNSSASTWNITHSLGYYPAVTVVDSAGTVVEGTTTYPSITTVTLTFSSPFSGYAYLS
jgi:hypothetical protein